MKKRKDNSEVVKRIKSLDDLKIYDDYMFGTVMKNEECCKIVLEAVLGVSISKIEYIEKQKEIKEEYEAKGIRLDAYIEDEEGTIYNIEMQQEDEGDLPERSRYYQAQITVNSLPEGKDYKKLNKSFVIFICRFDPFKEKRYVYRFTYKEENNPELELNDGTIIVFLNTKGKCGNISDELKGLLEYFDGKQPTTDGAKRLQEQVDRYKSDVEWRKKHMTVEDLIIRNGKHERAEGRVEGEEICLIKQVKKKKENGKEICQIADELDEKVQVIEDIYNSVEEADNKEDIDEIYEIYNLKKQNRE